MILFQSDWARFPSAIVHWRTKNTSFLRMAEIYRKMGVKNYLFHLALFQPELEDVDPHDPNLSIEIMGKIATECRFNPWYFFRECVKVPPQGSAVPLQLRANRGNLALWWLFFNHIDPALIQPRQTGKSLSTDALNILLIVLLCTHSRINMLTKDDKLRSSNIDRLKKLRLYLPPYLQALDKRDSDNMHEIVCSLFDNIFSSAVAQNNEAAALNIGRGLTAPVAHIDEGPFINYIDTTIPAMLAAGTAARDEAKEYGRPYGTIFTTTAGKKDSRSGKYMYELIHGGMVWTEALLDVPNETVLRQTVRNNSRGRKPLVNITMSHRQLGYSDEWLAKALEDSNAYGEEADRDFFNKWTSGGLSSPLATELNERLRQSEREPYWTEFSPHNYALRWHVPHHEVPTVMKRKVILGMDTSDAIGRDAITMVFVDASTFEVLAAANVNEANLILFTGWVADLMIKYPGLILIPERRGSGQTLIDTLLVRLPAAGIDPFRRIYNLIVDNSHDYKEEYRLIQQDVNRRGHAFYEQQKRMFGFATSGSGQHSRNVLYSETLQRAARLGCDKCYDRSLIDEITGLVTKNGRLDHSESGHDDMVIAWLLAAWFLTTSKNLAFYGITAPLDMAKEYRQGVVSTAVVDPYQQYVDEKQRLILAEIEQKLEELRACEDDYISMQLEHRLRVLESRLVQRYSETNSMAALIEEAQAHRHKQVRERMRQRSNGGQITSYMRRQQQTSY